MSVQILGKELNKKSNLYIDEDGQGRVLLPKQIIQAMGVRKGSVINMSCNIETHELKIKPNGKNANVDVNA